MFKEGKDKILSLFLRQRINDLLQEMGSVESLSINTTDHTLHAAIQLEDEPALVELEIRGYKILTEGEQRFLQLGETTVSKRWLEIVIGRFLVGKRIALPSEYADLVERLLG